MFRRICLLLGALATLGLTASTGRADILFLTSDGFEYEIRDYSSTSAYGGQLTRGGNDKFTTAPFSDTMKLEVNGTAYQNPVDAVETTAGGREVVLNPARLSRLYVNRRVYVPAIVGEYARFIDTFRNPTTDSITVTVEYSGRYYGGGVAKTSSGDANLNTTDRWFILSDDEPATQTRVPIAVWFQNDGEVAASTASFTGSSYSGGFSIEFELTIPPLEQRGLISYVLQAESVGELEEELQRIDSFPSDAIVNFAGAPSDAVNMKFGGAPLIRPAIPYEMNEGDAVPMSLTVLDREGDNVTFSWDFDDDGVFGDAGNQKNVMLPAKSTDGPGRRYVRVRASDGDNTRERRFFFNVNNLPPTLNGPPPIADVPIGQTYNWKIDATDPAGDLDPLLFRLITGPENASIQDGAVVWTPSSEQRNLDFMFHIEIDDQDGEIVEEMWSLSVGENRPPEPPTPDEPKNRAEVNSATPTLTVLNSVDPDGDPVVYRFRVDASAAFDSSALIESADLKEGADGKTSWTLPKALERGQYYWQVRAFDGVAESAPRGGRFVWTAGMGVLADGGVELIEVPDVGIYNPRSECGVQTKRSPLGMWALIGAIGLVLRLRSHRRWIGFRLN